MFYLIGLRIIGGFEAMVCVEDWILSGFEEKNRTKNKNTKNTIQNICWNCTGFTICDCKIKLSIEHILNEIYKFTHYSFKIK